LNNPNNEPTLESIEDYDTLKGSKKRTIWLVVIVSLLVGTVYEVVSQKFSNVDDSIEIQDPIKNVRIK
jgi:hypothetical protein